ncbi:hypothetical protein MJO28_012890 [Puccinia striiformis f. sp. tritici]|uniref:Uncharacterized protein n=1 Tax=Puccinia striiformis f. sp. tritici TaxID=168172 RepID=A0ACC0DX98_9BASI|nr:hypothetical protein MJO28_012890 [Puccinia striiformis f. sp. tritici]
MIDLNPEGWVVAQRLKFNHNNLGGQQSAYQARYDQHLKASTLPLTIKVKKTTIIGQGSMRKAYLALVKTDGQNGVRVHDEYPGINLNHATDACMYEACGHLFCAFQVVISRSTSHVLDDGIRQKIKAFDLVQHCVAFVGDPAIPSRQLCQILEQHKLLCPSRSTWNGRG